MKRGEIYRVHMPGGDPKRRRLFVIVSRQSVIDSKFSTVICAPVFSNGEGLATQVGVGPDHGVKRTSWIMCDNLVSLRKSELSRYVAMLPTAKLTELDRALRTALSL